MIIVPTKAKLLEDTLYLTKPVEHLVSFFTTHQTLDVKFIVLFFIVVLVDLTFWKKKMLDLFQPCRRVEGCGPPSYGSLRFF